MKSIYWLLLTLLFLLSISFSSGISLKEEGGRLLKETHSKGVFDKEKAFLRKSINNVYEEVHEFENKKLPLVIWHGMGDFGDNPISTGYLRKVFEEDLGVYVKSIMIGGFFLFDVVSGFVGNVNAQVDMVCKELREDVKLKDGFNAIGFSQGGQFLRAYVQRCNTPKVHNLVSVGGQHQGVSHLPHCGSSSVTYVHGIVCDLLKQIISFVTYLPVIRNIIVQAQYWHDETNEANYLKHNVFLPDLNNELPVKNQTYKKNLMSLNKFVMVKFLNDTMVLPRESEQFEFVDPQNPGRILPLRESKLYLEDHLGLQVMDKQGQLVFLETLGQHLSFDWGWMEDNVYPYLNGEK